MDNFKHRDKEIEFWNIAGEVLSQSKYSETHVSSSGGGGYIGKDSGYVNLPRVQSKSVTNHEFWIKTDDGQERSVQLTGIDIPLREGQLITLIYAGMKGKNSRFPSVLVNQNAQKHWFINDAGALNRLLGIDVISGKSLLINLLILYVLVLLGSMLGGLGELVAGCFIIFKLATRYLRIRELRAGLNQHLESLAQAAYKRS